MAVKKKAVKKVVEKKLCTQCQKNLFVNQFYASKNEKFADGKLPICRDCFIGNCFDSKDNYIRTEDFKELLMQMDMVFLERMYRECIQENEDYYTKRRGVPPSDYKKGAIGRYIKRINSLPQYKDLRWSDSELESWDSINEKDYVPPKQWTETDVEHKKFCLKVLGYNPFDDESVFTDSDCKYGFNVLYSYLTEEVIEDQTKIEGVLSLVSILMHLRNTDHRIHKLLNSPKEHEGTLTGLITSRNKLSQDLDRTVKSFGLKEATETAGKNSFTLNLKNMKKSGHVKGWFNTFEVNTSEIMQQVSDMSTQSICTQLNFDSNDYSEMLKEQHKLIKALNEQVAQLEEENRNYYNRIKFLEGEIK